jgi:hypothetical protein
MTNFKKQATEWAEEMLSKQPFKKTPYQMEELLILGSLVYDTDGNWISRLQRNQSFKIKPVKIKNNKIAL